MSQQNRHQRRKAKSLRKIYEYPKDIDKSSILKLGPEWWFCPASKRWWPPHSSVQFGGLNIPIKSTPGEEDEADLPLSISFGGQKVETMEFLKDGKSVPKSGVLKHLPEPLEENERGLIITPNARIEADGVQIDVTPSFPPAGIRAGPRCCA